MGICKVCKKDKKFRINGVCRECEIERDEFLFSLDGLIDGQYFRIETDSKKVIEKIVKLMDSQSL